MRDHLVEPEKEVARAVTELDDPFDVIDHKCLWLVERIARARHMGVRVIPLRDFLLQEFFTVVSAARTSGWNSAGFSAGRRESGEVPRLRDNASESCAGTTEAGTITCPHRTAPHRTVSGCGAITFTKWPDASLTTSPTLTCPGAVSMALTRSLKMKNFFRIALSSNRPEPCHNT